MGQETDYFFLTFNPIFLQWPKINNFYKNKLFCIESIVTNMLQSDWGQTSKTNQNNTEEIILLMSLDKEVWITIS